MKVPNNKKTWTTLETLESKERKNVPKNEKSVIALLTIEMKKEDETLQTGRVHVARIFVLSWKARKNAICKLLYC